MTKKHFVALADALRDSKPYSPAKPEAMFERQLDDLDVAMAQWNRDVTAMANFCASQNWRFNRERWLGYINGENGPNGGAVK